jgi:hypothetical protein
MPVQTLRTGRWSVATLSLIAALGVVLASAKPAHAENDFANGFEDQLGRLVAVEAFQLGHLLLAGVFQPPAYYSGVVHAAPPVRDYRDAYVAYEPPRRHHARRRAWRGHDDHDCDEHRRVRRNRDYDDEYYDD